MRFVACIRFCDATRSARTTLMHSGPEAGMVSVREARLTDAVCERETGIEPA